MIFATKKCNQQGYKVKYAEVKVAERVVPVRPAKGEGRDHFLLLGLSRTGRQPLTQHYFLRCI